MQIRNAIIDSTIITNDYYGSLTIWIVCKYGGARQRFGYGLYLPKSFRHNSMKDSGNDAGHFIWRVMEVAEVKEWKELIGKSIRVKAEHEKIYEIGHITKEIWFNPEKEFNLIKSSITNK